jgi:Holliday junction resolvasome RuvABC endonuclease subunit
MLLGLDISTSITGITVLDKEGKIVYNDALDTRKHKSFFVKARTLQEKLKEIKKNYKIKEIYIEKSLQSFRSGFSSAKTLSTLSSFNGIVSWMCFEIFKKEPEYVAATSARKLCGIKIPRGEKAKPVVLKFLLDNEPSFVVEYTKFGNPKPKYYDMADSIIVAKAGFELCKRENN